MKPAMHVRIGGRRRTFHTHGFPYPHGGGVGVRVNTWERSRIILARSYRDLRALGLGPHQARQIIVDLMLVPA